MHMKNSANEWKIFKYSISWWRGTLINLMEINFASCKVQEFIIWMVRPEIKLTLHLLIFIPISSTFEGEIWKCAYTCPLCVNLISVNNIKNVISELCNDTYLYSYIKYITRPNVKYHDSVLNQVISSAKNNLFSHGYHSSTRDQSIRRDDVSPLRRQNTRNKHLPTRNIEVFSGPSKIWCWPT